MTECTRYGHVQIYNVNVNNCYKPSFASRTVQALTETAADIGADFNTIDIQNVASNLEIGTVCEIT